MKEQLILFETAKLAKEKGFDIILERGSYTYDTAIKKLTFISKDIKKFINNGFIYIAPTQSLLQKWLREEHNIHATSHCKNTKNPKGTYVSTVEFNNETEHYHFGWDTYEQALEKGLQKALKLVENGKTNG